MINNNKNIFYWVLAVSLGLYSIPHIIHIICLKTSILSNQIEDWNDYVEFINNSLNPILGLGNILALVIISFKLKEIEDERIRKDKEVESLRIKAAEENEEKRIAE